MKTIQVDYEVHAWLKKNRQEKSISDLIKTLIEEHTAKEEKS